MQPSFDVNEYWLKRGRNYLNESLPQQFHRLQEQFLIDILCRSRIPLATILELGCGFGRITRVLMSSFPGTKITALDLSPEQLENAKRYCGRAPNTSFQQYDLYSGQPFPGADYDVMLAVEVFLHHPQLAVSGLFQRLAQIAGHLINIDWSENWPWKTADHVWVHDYNALYLKAGLQCATFVLPAKVDGKQQKLFIAAKHLSPEIRKLEQEMAESLAQYLSANAETDTKTHPEPEVANWPAQLDLAVQEIREKLPVGSSLILVNEDQWGNESRTLSDYKVFPFLEQNGQYWGPPANDVVALSELQRLRGLGANHIVFAWSSFWWLEQYRGLHQQLRSDCDVLLENERLKIFRLPPILCA